MGCVGNMFTLCAYAQQGYAFGRVGLCAYVYGDIFPIGLLAGLYLAYRPMNHTISDITYHEIHMLLGVGHFEFSEHAHSVPQHMLECKMAAGWH